MIPTEPVLRPPAHAGWVRLLHWTGAISVLTLAITGFVILMAHPRLYWGQGGNDLTIALIELPISRNYQHGGWEAPDTFPTLGRLDVVSAGRTYDIFNANGWGRSLHFLAGWVLVAGGLCYLLIGVVTGHLRRHLWPSATERTTAALAADLRDHLRFRIRAARGGPEYGPLQKLAYTAVTLIALPAAVVTGLTMSPAITAASPWLLTALNGFQSARTIHFVLALGLVLFALAHVILVVVSGFRTQMRGMVLGLIADGDLIGPARAGVAPPAVVIDGGPVLGRRRWLAATLATMAGVIGYRFSRGDLPAWRELPPTGGHPLRIADTLTYAAQRAALPSDSLAPEYTLAELTAFPSVGTSDPLRHKDPAVVESYSELSANQFADWQLQVEGAVDRPRAFSLAELKALPARTQITRHACEEGWSAVAQWTGVPLHVLLAEVGIRPSARFVVLYTVDDLVDSIDMRDALHPQTIVAYGMNGSDLPVRHGAPLRLRVERQIGYKSAKYLTRIVVTEAFEDGGPRGNIQNGWSWYVGI